jgi:hypothetical protein
MVSGWVRGFEGEKFENCHGRLDWNGLKNLRGVGWARREGTAGRE